MLNKILVNGINAGSAGGKAVILNFIFQTNRLNIKHKYHFILTEEIKKDIVRIIENQNPLISFQFVPKPNFLQNLRFYLFGFNKIIYKEKFKAVLNFGDIPIRTTAFQILYFDWPYLIYPNSKIWKMMSFREWLSRKLKVKLIKLLLNNVTHFIAQTSTSKKRLKDILKIENITVLNNPHTKFKDEVESLEYDFDSSKKYFFCLTKYYPHKNLESIIPLAAITKKLKLNIIFLLTIDSAESKGAELLLKNIEKRNLDDVIINLGTLSYAQINYVYKKINCIYLPTILESFSGVYIDALHKNIPILTSKIDFAIDSCGEGAIYFDPFNESSQLDAIKSFLNDFDIGKMKEDYKSKREEFIDWEKKFNNINALFEKIY